MNKLAFLRGYMNKISVDKLQGGEADGMTEKDIAKDKNVSIEQVKEQVSKGEKMEREHSSDPEIQREIAKDHIEEFPKYYNALPRMEKQLRNNSK